MSRELSQESSRLEQLINQVFWLPEKKRYAYAVDEAGKPIDEPSVLATVPMWFGLLRQEQAQSMISELAAPEHQTDWGMRILSSQSAKYSGGGYHYGSVWPLFTGWASVGEYHYHRALPAYTNLRSNALLALDGSLGHVTEVLSGDYYQPLSTSSPHQIWSAAMVVSPLLRGLLGLSAEDAKARLLRFAPHVPANWTSFAIKNVRVGECVLNLHYHRTAENITLEADRSSSGDCMLEFSPAISFAAEVMSVEINGHPLQYRILKSAVDQHVSMRFPVTRGPNKVGISIRNDFGLALTSALPSLGTRSHGLRVVSESWSDAGDRLDLVVAGISGSVYELGVWNAEGLRSVDGAEWIKGTDFGKLRLRIPGRSEGYAREKIVFHFAERRAAERVKSVQN